MTDDAERPTPKQSGTLQLAPVRAVLARERVLALRAERDRCSEAGSALRALTCQRLANDFAALARELDSWRNRDPGPIKRAEVMDRWVRVDNEATIVLRDLTIRVVK